MNTLKRSRPAARGQALVEFALVIPMLVFLLMGMFDLGRGIYAYNVVASAAREGARLGITQSPLNAAAIRSYAFANTTALDPTQLTMDAPVCSPDCETGAALTVTIRYHFQPITLFFASIDLVGKSTMTIE